MFNLFYFIILFIYSFFWPIILIEYFFFNFSCICFITLLFFILAFHCFSYFTLYFYSCSKCPRMEFFIQTSTILTHDFGCSLMKASCYANLCAAWMLQLIIEVFNCHFYLQLCQGMTMNYKLNCIHGRLLYMCSNNLVSSLSLYIKSQIYC